MTTLVAARASTAPIGGSRTRRDAVVRRAAVLVLWSSLLLVAYWWAAGGGIAGLAGWTGDLDSVGRLTGLIASVLLLARLPVLEHAYGQDRLARTHRLVGFTSFTLILAHIGLITIGYADGRPLGAWTTFWGLAVDYPGMLLAVAGTACLVAEVVTIVAGRDRDDRRRVVVLGEHCLQDLGSHHVAASGHPERELRSEIADAGAAGPLPFRPDRPQIRSGRWIVDTRRPWGLLNVGRHSSQ